MDPGFYTLASWRVPPQRREAFVAAWTDMGRAFSRVPGAAASVGTLIESVDTPGLFYSFGPWSSLEAIQRMRSDAGAGEAMARVKALCDEATPGAYRVVSQVRFEPPS